MILDACDLVSARAEGEARARAEAFYRAGIGAQAALAPYTGKGQRPPQPTEWVPLALRERFFPERIRSAAELDASARAAGFDPDTGKPLARA